MTEEPLSGVPDGCQDRLTAAETLASVMEVLYETISAAGPLERIGLWRRLRERIDEGIDEAVAGARMSGDSWDTIGRAAGMSRQAAHGRWAQALDPADTGNASDEKPKATELPEAKEGHRARKGKPQREVVGVRVAGMPFGVTFDITRRRIDEPRR